MKMQGWDENYREKVSPGKEKRHMGTSLVIQCLRLCASNPVGAGSVPGWGTKFVYAVLRPHMPVWPKKKKKERKKKKRHSFLLRLNYRLLDETRKYKGTDSESVLDFLIFIN